LPILLDEIPIDPEICCQKPPQLEQDKVVVAALDGKDIHDSNTIFLSDIRGV
jgi:hypothetical protein